MEAEVNAGYLGDRSLDKTSYHRENDTLQHVLYLA